MSAALLADGQNFTALAISNIQIVPVYTELDGA
jgi:hypothetical protein